MARTSTKKTETIKKEDTVEVKNNDNIKEKELEEAKKREADLLNMINNLQQQIQTLASNQNNNSNIVIKQNEDLTRLVKVTSLLNNTYNLTTERLGRGDFFTFRKFGETKSIKFTDMQKIVEIYRKDFEIGRAILGSKKDYEDLNIGYLYNESLTNDNIEQLVLLEENEYVDTILNLDKEMQENIATLIADKIASGISYDYNKIKRLEDEGLKITELVKQRELENEEE